MARKRSGGRGGRSKKYRDPSFRVTCKGCGKVQEMPVRPMPGVDIYCMECHTSNNSKDKATASAN